jgi:hypothetical protein
MCTLAYYKYFASSFQIITVEVLADLYSSDCNKSKEVDFEPDWCDYIKKLRLKLIYK